MFENLFSDPQLVLTVGFLVFLHGLVFLMGATALRPNDKGKATARNLQWAGCGFATLLAFGNGLMAAVALGHAALGIVLNRQIRQLQLEAQIADAQAQRLWPPTRIPNNGLIH